MNINPSQYPRAVSSFFFVLILLSFGTAQANVFQRMIRNLSIPTPLNLNSFKANNVLFTALFTTKSAGELKELPFEQAKKNWEDLLDVVRETNDSGRTQIEETNLEAAAMSFVHQKFSGEYFPYDEVLTNGIPPSEWREESLGMFFYRKFSIGHYMSPHFTLTPENPFHHLFMLKISQSEFFKLEENFALLDSKEFVLKILNDVTEEIRAMGSVGTSSSAFVKLIVYFSLRRPGGSSMGSQPFLRALEEAARENDRLAQVVDNIKEFTRNSNLEDYEESLFMTIQQVAR